MESYPERFCIAILKALRQSMRHVGLFGNMEAGYHVDEPDMSHEVAKYFDDITGIELEPKLVQKARAEEVEFLERLGTWRDATEEECIRETGKKPLPSRWVDIKKGDLEHKEYRSRLTVKEIKAKYPMDASDVFAATPPIECLRLSRV